MYSINNSGIKGKEIMGSSSDLFQNQQQSGGGLMRYRSAPSSYFASFLDGNGGINNSTNTTSYGDSSESDSMFSVLLNCHEPSSTNLKNHGGFEVSGARKKEINEVVESNGNGFCNGGGDNNNNDGIVGIGGYLAAVSAGGGSVVGSYSLPIGGHGHGHGHGSGPDNNRVVQPGNCSNLVRQSSSPAGFFSGFDMMQEVGSLKGSTNNGDATPSTSSGLNNSISFGSSSKTRFMPSIAEIGNETVETGSPENEQFGSGNDNGSRGYTASRFSRESWDDIPFNNLKRSSDGEIKMFSDFIGLENQGMELPRNHTSGLTHHLSLPKTAVEMAAVEKYLQFQQDSVPCKIRAKRGCATHPRSIAERMRRIRISERMKKLQELFPTMDKQANTADMLELAVEHIKTLQKQVQTLKETRAKCTCSTKQEHTPCPSSL